LNCEVYNSNAGSSNYGGIYNDKGTITSCNIHNNSNCGIYNDNGTITSCNINNNTSTAAGGGVYNIGGTITNCEIFENVSDKSAGGIYNSGGTVSDCIIRNNSGIISGNVYANGIYNSGTLNNCLVYKNSGSGWGIDNRELVYNCKVYDNANGGIANGDTVENCIVFNHIFDGKGSGIYNYSYGKVKNCLIFNNYSSGDGAGIYNSESNGIITNCIILGCGGLGNGGGIYNDGKVVNCTVYRNRTTLYGGGIYNLGTVINSIAWNNTSGDISSEATIISSCFSEAQNGVNGNIRANPFFVNTSGDNILNWDFHLQNGSPCVDTGTLTGSYIPTDDIDGNPRPGNDGKICIGAYESPDVYENGIPLSTKRLYVSPSGDNSDGTSWQRGFNKIKSAITETISDNDVYEIWVAKGTYLEGETITVEPKITFYGGFQGNEDNLNERDIENNPTIIDGNNSYRCINNFSIFDGFHITKGYVRYYEGEYNRAGGIYNYKGTIKKCKIYDCVGEGVLMEGGGIYNDRGIISDCEMYHNNCYSGSGLYNYYGTVTNCRAYDSVSEVGGTIANDYGTITDCIVYNNNSSRGTAGIYNNNGTLIKCTVYGNNARNGGGISDLQGMILNCIVYNNSIYSPDVSPGVWSKGSGIFTWSGTISNCIVYNNVASGVSHSDDKGSGIETYEGGTIVNCTVYNNTARSGGGGITNTYGTVSNTISWGNSGIDIFAMTISYSCYKESDGNNSNISANPLFINTSGDVTEWDFHLQDNSPCINAGNPNSEYNDGSIPPGKGTLRCDMGAYGGPENWRWEFDTRVPDTYPQVQEAIENAIDGNKIVVTPGTYIENIRFMGKNIVLQSVDPTDSSVVANTILDGDCWGSAVTFDGSETPDCILSGFTITNGFARAGGGICGNGTRATIENNHITNNFCYRIIPYGDFGAGIFGCDGLLQNNIINNNFANFAGGGLAYCDGKIQNNLIFNNSAISGGAFYFCDGEIYNNTVYGNSANHIGGGFDGCNGVIKNCIVWENTAPDGAQLFDSSIPSYSCIQSLGESENGVGNISDDPQLADPDGADNNLSTFEDNDFHLTSNSPCIDAGCFIEGLTKDIEGNPRGFKGASDFRGDGSNYDIGAYELIRNSTEAIYWMLWD